MGRGEKYGRREIKSGDTLPSISFYSMVPLQLTAHIIESMQKTEWKKGGRKKGKTENMKRERRADVREMKLCLS